VPLEVSSIRLLILARINLTLFILALGVVTLFQLVARKGGEMFNPLNMVAPYDGALEFLEKLPGYDSSSGVIEQLELAKQIQQSGKYYWQGIPFPNQDNWLVAAGDTVSGSIQVPVGSYITSIQVYNDYDANPAGFKLNLFDKGSKAYLYYGDYMLNLLAGSDMQLFAGSNESVGPSDPGMNSDIPFGPGYFQGPFIVTNPGIIGWELVNAGVSDAIMQVLMCLAVPINPVSIGQRRISRGS
jgi:hypothetical protein